MPGILSEQEKNYCLGLEAIRKKDYVRADFYFQKCASLYGGSEGFEIIAQATQILAFIEERRHNWEKTKDEIKETIENGKETVLRREGVEEKTR